MNQLLDKPNCLNGDSPQVPVSALKRTILNLKKIRSASLALALIALLAQNGSAMPSSIVTFWNLFTGPISAFQSAVSRSLGFMSPAAGTITFGGMGEAYTQDFDTLANSNNDSVMPDGWYFEETGSGANTTYQASDGNGASGDTFSYGTGQASDRALGSMRTNQVASTFGASFTNSTGGTITSLDISFYTEEWRLGNAGRTDRTDFQISTNATSLSTGTWTDKNSFDLVTPDTANAGQKDGNSAGSRASVSASITGLSIADGATFWIRWVDADGTGNDDGLGVDDFSITAQGTAPPNTTINSGPSSPTNSTSATFTFSSNDGTATFECSKDGGAYSACTSPNSSSGLAAGSHSFAVRAKNAAGTDATPATSSWTIDLTEPDTSITSAPGSYSNSSSASITFSASDASAISALECSVDSGTYSACTSPLSLSSLSEGAHSLSVKATDAAGNVESTPASVSWTVDLTSPAVTDFTPMADPAPSQAASFDVDVADSVSLASVAVQYIVGNQNVASASCSLSSGNTYTCSIPGQNNNATVKYYVLATDSAGNTTENPSSSTPNVYTVGPGTIPPGQYKHLNPASGATLSGDVTVSGTLTLDGNLNTGSNKITLGCNATVSGAGAGKFVKGRLDKSICATGTFVFPMGTQKTTAIQESSISENLVAVTDEYTPLTVQITSGTFPSTLAVSVADTTMTGATSTQSLKRTWTVTETGDVTATLTFSYLDGDVVGTEGLYSVLKRDGSTTSTVSGGTIDATANTFSVSGVTTFSDWSAGVVAETVEPNSSISSTSVSGVTSNTSNTISFGATDDTGVDYLECSLDNASYTTCTSPLALTGLADGQHTLRVRSVDVVGNVESTPASFSWTVDTTAPSSGITVSPSSLDNSASASFTFSATDANGVASYQCKLDSGSFSSCTSPKTYSSLSDGSHTFVVKATDTAGNTEATGSSVTWTVDTTAPSSGITVSPSSLDNSASASFTFSATDANGVASYQCKLDSGSFSSCTSPKTYSSLSDGSHTFVVKATDTAGNTEATGSSVTWTVDTTAPDTAFSSKPDAVSGSASAVFSFSATDSSSVSGYLCSLDGGTYSACTSPHTISSLSDGSHTLQVKATDAAGNTESSPASWTWTVDTTAPDTSFSQTPNSVVNSSSATLAFAATDATSIAGYECKVDTGSYAACSSPLSLTGLAAGAHTVTVRATDAAGNLEPTPAQYSWTIDLTNPQIASFTPASAPNPAQSRTISVTATDNIAIDTVAIHYNSGASDQVAACTLNGTSFDCTIPGQVGGTVVTYYISASDTAGNGAVAPSETVRNLYTVGAASIPSGSYKSVNPGAGSTLAGDIQVEGVLTLAGMLYGGGHDLTISCDGSVSGASANSFVAGAVKKNYCATGTFEYPVGTSVTSNSTTLEEFSPAAITVTAVNSPSALKIEASKSAVVGASVNQRIERQWQLTETGDLTADLLFNYFDSDVVGTESLFQVIKRTGQTTAIVSGGTVDANANTFSVNGVSTFSSWGAGLLTPLSAGIDIGGTVLDSEGRGIANVSVYLAGGRLAEPITLKTNQFGRYHFEGLEVGAGYIIGVVSRKHRFSSPQRFVQPFDSLENENFIADPR